MHVRSRQRAQSNFPAPAQHRGGLEPTYFTPRLHSAYTRTVNYTEYQKFGILFGFSVCYANTLSFLC